jgi:cytidine deaminase
MLPCRIHTGRSGYAAVGRYGGIDRRGEGEMTDEQLLSQARDVKARAYAPYSGFSVGAALLSRDGRVFTAVNVENASIGLSVCAERNAIAKAVSEGALEFETLAIATDSPEPTMPCGVCRQVLWEFAQDLRIVVGGADGSFVTPTIAELFPRPFTTYKPSG